MSELLPPSATQLERLAATVGAKVTDLPVILRALWNPEDCPAELLPWLAWAWSVDSWNAKWSDRQKRNTIAEALEVQQIKGTIGAVRTALGAIGIDARVQEWHRQTPQAEPYTFRLLLEAEQTPVDQAGLDEVLAIIARTKNLRSHLSRILVSATSRAPVHVATVANRGDEITVTHFQPRLLVTNELAIVV
ncbi:phage tail protein I [Halomonas sp. HK25]|uniref:phage tail protein I n=1 Tax=Halomonas sp. HK25 TaxID=3394321 RepID=UPI0039FB9112